MPKCRHCSTKADYQVRLAEWELLILRAASIFSLLFALAKFFWSEIKRW